MAVVVVVVEVSMLSKGGNFSMCGIAKLSSCGLARALAT